MKKKKLELKDIVGYLPYGMLFEEQANHTVLRMDNIETRNSHQIWATQKYIRGLGKDVNDINYPYLSARNCSAQGFKLKEVKPVLHPMSDLVHSITVKGYNGDKEFIPLIEMAKYETSNKGISYKLATDPVCEGYYVDITMKDSSEPVVYWFNRDVEYYSLASMWELDFLNQWMFDYRGLIDDNLAININKI